MQNVREPGEPGVSAVSRKVVCPSGATDCLPIGVVHSGNTVWQANRGTRQKRRQVPKARLMCSPGREPGEGKRLNTYSFIIV